ncbi:hypothetical protein EW026_g6837 [Hermanssonia centrifuga]|uniref:Uncharacterized protein n=1 Tax=Hermanssonia centrifuga TaxID=98765 RepID=A0A4S4KE46_9APHY|nr:hypothetical protein EW026_g6837 [Hermanssonia centrifuga]
MGVQEGSSSVVPSKRRRAQDPEHKDSVSDLAKEPGHPFDLSVLDSLRAHVSKVKVDLSEWTAQEPADAAGLPVSQQPGVPVDEAGLMVENINYLRAHISRVKSDISKWMEQEPADSDVNGLPVFQQSGAPVNEARLPVEGVDSLHIHTAQYPPELAESPFSKHPRALQNLQQAPQQAGSGILAIVDTERHYFDLSMLDKVMAPVSEAEIPMEGVDSLRGHVSKVKYDLSKRKPQEDEKGGDEEDHEAFLSMKAVPDLNSMDVDIPASSSPNRDPLASKDYFKDDPNYIYIKQEFMEAISQDIQEDMDEYLQLTKEIADLKAALGFEEAFTTRSSFLSKR